MTTTKKRPDYLAYVPLQRTGQPPKFAKIGVGFTYKNGSIGVLYDAVPLSGQIVLIGIDDELPATISYGPPTRAADFDACMVRESGNDSFWTEIGSGYRQEGYISVLTPLVPTAGKIVLSTAKA